MDKKEGKSVIATKDDFYNWNVYHISHMHYYRHNRH